MNENLYIVERINVASVGAPVMVPVTRQRTCYK